MPLWARGVEFSRVGHRFNSRSWVGTSTTCCKWPRHLVNGRARGKGILWRNRSCSKRVLWGCGRRRQCSTVHNMQLDVCDTHRTPSAAAQAQAFPAQSQYFIIAKRLLCTATAALSKASGLFSTHGKKCLRSVNTDFICVGRRPIAGYCNLLLLLKWKCSNCRL